MDRRNGTQSRFNPELVLEQDFRKKLARRCYEAVAAEDNSRNTDLISLALQEQERLRRHGTELEKLQNRQKQFTQRLSTKVSMVKELEEEIKKVRERYEQTKLVHEHMDEKSRDLQKTISTIQVPKLPEKKFDAEEKTAFLTAFKARIAEKLAERNNIVDQIRVLFKKQQEVNSLCDELNPILAGLDEEVRQTERDIADAKLHLERLKSAELDNETDPPSLLSNTFISDHLDLNASQYVTLD